MDKHLSEKLKRYKQGLWIGLITVALQILIYVLFANSKSLLGDALHAVSDNIVILGVVMLTATELASGAKTGKRIERNFTRAAIMLLFASAAFVTWEGLERIFSPEKFPGVIVLVVTTVAATGSFFVHRSISGIHESVQDHKHKASVLHVLADLVISIIVVIAVLLTMLFNAPAIDGWGAIAVAIWMVVRGVMLWRESSGHECKGDCHAHGGHHHNCTHHH